MVKRSSAEDPRQRQLGSIEAEVVNGLLPASAKKAPLSVVDFDGWDETDVRGWLESLGLGFRQVRSVIGLGLWVLRDRMVSEEDYAAAVRELAERYEVASQTLWRWRRLVQTELGLPDPAGAVGRAKASAAGVKAKVAKQAQKAALVASERDQRGATTAEVVARDDTRQVEVQPPAAQAEGPGATSTTVSPRAPGSSSARGAEPPAPPITAEWLAEQLAARKPTEARAMSVATFAKLESWVQQARAVRPRPTGAASPRRREDADGGSAKCLHPVTRRIGDRCGACGASTKAAR